MNSLSSSVPIKELQFTPPNFILYVPKGVFISLLYSPSAPYLGANPFF